MCKNCDTCKHLLYDGSTGTYECKRMDDMTEEDVRHFEDNTAGCSCYEEDTTDYEAEDEYFASLEPSFQERRY